MKGKTAALAIVPILLLLTMYGVQITLTKANFLFPPSNPSITILSPKNNGTYNTGQLMLEITVYTYKTAYEENGVSRSFLYSIDGRRPEDITITNSSIGKVPGSDVFFKGAVSLPKLAQGIHHLTVQVVFDYNPMKTGYDSYDHGFHKESAEFVTFRIDTTQDVPFEAYDETPPEITLKSPKNEKYNNSGITLEFYTNETASEMFYKLDSDPTVEISGNTTITGLLYGPHSLTVYARDDSDNTGSSETVYFSITEPESEFSPTMLVIASTGTVAAIGVALLVYFKKHTH